jgi:hypothetical protein
MDLPIEWAGQSSQDHRATVLLRQEHERLLDLFRRQHEPVLDPPTDRQSLEVEIVAVIDLIDRVADEVLFHALPDDYAPQVRTLAAEHRDLSRCLVGLRRAADNAARRNASGERLEQLARDHIAHQEAMLFTPIEREHPDLNRALYDQLVSARARLADLPIVAS